VPPNLHRIERPQALKIPARRAEYSLTENVASPFHAEPRHPILPGKCSATIFMSSSSVFLCISVGSMSGMVHPNEVRRCSVRASGRSRRMNVTLSFWHRAKSARHLERSSRGRLGIFQESNVKRKISTWRESGESYYL
jgi:hypothetical protein